jgi:hypothetical protein
MGFFKEFRKYRGQRVITCPETDDGAAVSVDAWHAATSGNLRLSACSRWPERAGCAQACLSQIADAPDGCLVSLIVAAWYAGKLCTVCGRPIGPTVWHEAPPAVLKDDGTTCEWKDVRVENLPAVFRTSKPLCWYCNNLAEVQRINPNLIIHRPRPAEPKAPPLRSDAVY